MDHFIRVEAVNIYNAIADTDNISVVRGGSLLLKQAIDDIACQFNVNIQPISTGASVGVFKVIKGDELKSSIINYLNKEEKYKYFTFVVEECESDDFLKAKEILIAKCRLSQLQQLSISPDYSQEVDAKPCELEGIRPFKILTTQWPGESEKRLSAFVDLKWKYGKKQRSKLYVDELTALATNKSEALKQLTFTSDLEELSGSNEFQNLDGKVAFIYFDGNSFSKIQNKLVNSDLDQQQFDNDIKTLRRQFLEQLLEATQCDASSWGFVKNNNKQNQEQSKWLVRLETLLWGGDEMLFVVPAWKGFELLNLFYQCSKEWVISIGNKSSEALTHAGGVVFCHHKTPIYKVRDLAQNLADNIKDSKNGRKANYFNYLVLESIDYPAESLSEFFSQQYGDLANYRQYLSPDSFNSISPQTIYEIQETLPKSQIYAITHAACQITTEAKEGEENQLYLDNYIHYELQIQRLIDVSSSKTRTEACIDTVYQVFKPRNTVLNLFKASGEKLDNQNLVQQAIAWLHLVELWDYYITVTARKEG